MAAFPTQIFVEMDMTWLNIEARAHAKYVPAIYQCRIAFTRRNGPLDSTPRCPGAFPCCLPRQPQLIGDILSSHAPLESLSPLRQAPASPMGHSCASSACRHFCSTPNGSHSIFSFDSIAIPLRCFITSWKPRKKWRTIDILLQDQTLLDPRYFKEGVCICPRRIQTQPLERNPFYKLLEDGPMTAISPHWSLPHISQGLHEPGCRTAILTAPAA